jgi:hypothetical protein
MVVQTNGAVRPIVRKKAATCLLRLIRKSLPEAEILQPDVWSVKLVRHIAVPIVTHSNHHLCMHAGSKTCSCTLLLNC